MFTNLSSVKLRVRIPGWPGWGCSDDLLDVDSLLGVADTSQDDPDVGDFGRDIEPDRDDDADDVDCCTGFSICLVEVGFDDVAPEESSCNPVDTGCWLVV